MVSENTGTGSFILQNNRAMLLCSCSEDETVRKFVCVCRSCETDTRSKIFEDVVTCYIVRNLFHLPGIRHFRKAISGSGS
jgi:hypothetical protein